jgi:hypothetical protein
MKNLIPDKKYDIQNAQLVAEYKNEYSSDDVMACSEELYLKKSGKYLLYGRGGTNTEWSEGHVKSGEGYRLLTVNEAQEWIKLHAHGENVYADLFGDAEE